MFNYNIGRKDLQFESKSLHFDWNTYLRITVGIESKEKLNKVQSDVFLQQTFNYNICHRDPAVLILIETLIYGSLSAV